MDVSIVVPVHNEAESIPTLAREIDDAFGGGARSWECIWVDDGCSDGSLPILRDLNARDSRHQFVSLRHRSGQSGALLVGMGLASGEVIATLDGDLQNDPAELLGLIDQLESGSADMVTGIRGRRADTWVRKVSSRVGNGFRNWITRDRIQDVGCSLRVFRRACITDLPRFNGMHRFLPTLLRMQGFQVLEVEVGHRPRRFGSTKYGIGNRLWRGIADCLAVRWMRSRVIRTEIAASSLDGNRARAGSS